MHLVESSIALEFPDNNYFRICDCNEYRRLNGIREMDVCWYDKNGNKLFLIELKDWGNASIDEENNDSIPKGVIDEKKKGIENYRIRNLLEKSIDSMCIFSSILLNRSCGRRVNSDIPFKIDLETKIILLSIVNWTDSDESYISNINTSYKSKFNSYAKLFGVAEYFVLTKRLAIKHFSWVKN
ncbi:MAG: hypothetical protein AAGI49_03060 [Bacteroidota bacterium]